MSTRPTVSSPESCLPDRLVSDEYRPCDFPTFIFTTVLQISKKSKAQLNTQISIQLTVTAASYAHIETNAGYR